VPVTNAMKTLSYTYIDKSKWGDGPWNDEPDKVQWQDKATGLPCLAVRNLPIGNWCGYVGVSASHPHFGKDYDDEAVDIDCHGGLTFAGACRENDKEHGICHRPDLGEDDHVWWLGFDCCHALDLMPGTAATLREVGLKPWPEDVYRDLSYVQKECASVAKQLKEASA
jgi:hypothetical protein